MVTSFTASTRHGCPTTPSYLVLHSSGKALHYPRSRLVMHFLCTKLWAAVVCWTHILRQKQILLLHCGHCVRLVCFAVFLCCPHVFLAIFTYAPCCTGIPFNSATIRPLILAIIQVRCPTVFTIPSGRKSAPFACSRQCVTFLSSNDLYPSVLS